ncbi:MAG: hypothetical protein BA864_01105 [Desulfuromonadales bacterium C00003093]|nr:MAG: hypothetical protein BA864_01105 [Desulfuromonadales bacterium C00003093]
MRERVLAIVNLIAKYVLGAEDAPINEQELIEELLQVGFDADEISDAFSWMESVTLQPPLTLSTETLFPEQLSYRIFSREEEQALTLEALGFLIKIREMGLLSNEDLEEVIERAVRAAEDPINLPEIKMITSLTLLSRSSNIWQRELDCFLENDLVRIYH